MFCQSQHMDVYQRSFRDPNNPNGGGGIQDLSWPHLGTPIPLIRTFKYNIKYAIFHKILG